MPVNSNSIPKVVGVAVSNVLVASAILSSIVLAIANLLVLILIFFLSACRSRLFVLIFFFFLLPLRLCGFCGVNPCGGWVSVPLPFTAHIVPSDSKGFNR